MNKSVYLSIAFIACSAVISNQSFADDPSTPNNPSGLNQVLDSVTGESQKALSYFGGLFNKVAPVAEQAIGHTKLPAPSVGFV